MEIHDKTQIKAALRKSFGSMVYAINRIEEKELFDPRAEGKWSPAEILGHLILSTKPLNKALSVPKFLLRSQFGKNNREEGSFERVLEKYHRGLESGVEAPPNFVFKGAKERGKDGMLDMFTKELNKLLEHIDKWSEKDLSTYILPHPAIGKLTIREMLFFTVFHTDHHLKQLEGLYKDENENVAMAE